MSESYQADNYPRSRGLGYSERVRSPLPRPASRSQLRMTILEKIKHLENQLEELDREESYNGPYEFDRELHQFDDHLHRFDDGLHKFDDRLHQLDSCIHQFDGHLHQFDDELHQFDDHLHQFDDRLHNSGMLDKPLSSPRSRSPSPRSRSPSPRSRSPLLYSRRATRGGSNRM